MICMLCHKEKRTDEIGLTIEGAKLYKICVDCYDELSEVIDEMQSIKNQIIRRQFAKIQRLERELADAQTQNKT